MQRPSPDKILARIQEEEKKRGKLKIYLGAAPGVGKTYSMLQDALGKREQGLDVVAGIVESHGRKEIDAMLQKFEVLPRQLIDYHGKPLLEFDLDGALARYPSLILIDEMAHTNVQGLRHNKRWQDIKELLDRGIDVYTTLNVQHIESLNDIISQIVGIRVRETVPDSMLALADTMELVDLPPDDLIKRLQEGKVYIPAQAELATKNFFRKGNLIALRELALRFTAESVDAQVLQHRQGQGIEQTWPTMERLLVCVGYNDGSTKVIRAAKRMASNLHAKWIAVFVEVPRSDITEQARNNAIQNLRLAEQLGAETRILTGIDIVKEIISYARRHNVTKILVGKRLRSRWREFFQKSLAHELIRYAGEIDVYVIRSEDKEIVRVKQMESKPPQININGYTIAIGLTGVTTIFNLLLYPYLGFSGASNFIMLYLISVVVISLRGEAGPSLLASFLSALAYIYFFVPPQFTLSVNDFQHVLTFIIMVVVAQIISHLALLTRQQAQVAFLGEQRTAALHTLSRQLASTRGTKKLLEIAMGYISEVFDSEVMALLSENNKLQLKASSTKKELNSKEFGVAQWVFDLGQMAGLGTDTLPFNDSLYIPLHGSQGTVGVLKIRPRQSEQLLIPEQLHLLEACANQIALALEVDRLQEKASETEVMIETQRLRTALFNSLSNELQNPLAAIVSLINLLTKKQNTLTEEETQKNVKSLYREVERLNRLINNLLQITRLEEGKVQLHKRMTPLEEVVKSSLSRIEKKLKNKPYVVQIPADLPEISFDKVLIEQVLVNIVENAILYTPPESPIEISATLEGENVLISIRDQGPGLLAEDIEKIFDKFYRGQKAEKASGAGLGLSVCQSIVKAHGGKIWAENGEQGGAVFHILLPIKQQEEDVSLS